MFESYLKPFKVSRSNLIRVGPKKDGGYIIHKDTIQYTKKIVSLGLNDDWEFEKSFLKKNKICSVVAYDHTINKKFWFRRFLLDCKNFFLLKKIKINQIIDIFKFIDYYFFFKKNIHYQIKVGQNSNEVNLKKILQKFNKEYEILLKIDIEGDEYKILSDIKNFSKFINTILIEFHDIDNNEKKNFIKNFIFENKIFKLIHINGNNYSIDSNGNPNCIELTFVNSDIFPDLSIKSDYDYPINGLDYPNLKRRKDCELKFE